MKRYNSSEEIRNCFCGYRKYFVSEALELEKEVFYEAYEELLTPKAKRTKQMTVGTSHVRRLRNMQEISIESNVNVLEFINRLRALTTNNVNETTYWWEEENALQFI
jgi:hypothetical protein